MPSSIDSYTTAPWFTALAKEPPAELWALARRACGMVGTPLVRSIEGIIVIDWCGTTPNESQLHGVELIREAYACAKVTRVDCGFVVTGIAAEDVPDAVGIIESLVLRDSEDAS